jgi:hypothetical protein
MTIVLSVSFSSSSLSSTRPRLSSMLLSIDAMIGFPCLPRGSFFPTNVFVSSSLCPHGPCTPWCQRWSRNGRSRFASMNRHASSVKRSVMYSPFGPSVNVWAARKLYGEK